MFVGMLHEALKVAYEALKYAPDYAPIYFNIANVLGKIGRYTEAEINFKTAISKNPTDPMYYTNLGKYFFFILYTFNNK